MAFAALIQQANRYRVDPTKSEDERCLVACRLMIESILESLKGDVRAITKENLDTLEQELRLIVNEFEEIEFSEEAEIFVANGWVSSVESISGLISNAYNSIGAASKIREIDYDDITGDQWEDYLARFKKCRRALREALNLFLI